MGAVLIVAAVVFAAELGDKSQLLALTLATRYPTRSVLIGLFIATALMHGLSVTVGAAVASVVPERAVTIAAGVLFLVFGALTLRPEHDDDEAHGVAVVPHRAAVPAVAGAFLAAEFGDKTMLASTTLAATHGALAAWIGATVGMFGASALAVAVGGQLVARLGPRTVRLGAAAGFAVVGIVLLLGSLRG